MCIFNDIAMIQNKILLLQKRVASLINIKVDYFVGYYDIIQKVFSDSAKIGKNKNLYLYFYHIYAKIL